MTTRSALRASPPQAGQHVQLPLLRQQLDIDAFAGLLPGLVQQVLLQLTEPALGRTHQVLHRRIAGPHLGQHLFGGDAPIHHPDPAGLAVLRLDLLEELSQCRLVRRVACQYIIGQRESLRRHDQRDDHLHAVRPLVPTVAELAFVVFLHRRIALKIRARQIVQQYVVSRVEQVPPTLRQMREESRLVRQEKIMTTVELVWIGPREVRPQQIGHRTAVKPLAMQPPLAARSDQPIHRQDRQHLIPAGALAARPQSPSPELIQLKLSPHLQRQPARSPLPRPMYRQRPQLQPRDGCVLYRGRDTILREQGHPLRLGMVVRQDLDRSGPGPLLGIADLAEVQHVPLDYPPVGQPAALHDAPVLVVFAVLPALGAMQIHIGTQLCTPASLRQQGRSSLQRVSNPPPPHTPPKSRIPA